MTGTGQDVPVDPAIVERPFQVRAPVHHRVDTVTQPENQEFFQVSAVTFQAYHDTVRGAEYLRDLANAYHALARPDHDPARSPLPIVTRGHTHARTVSGCHRRNEE